MAGAKRGPKRLDDIRDPVLKRIFEVMPRWRTSQAELCKDLGINAGQFSRNRVMGLPIDRDILERVAWRSDCRVEWLQTGADPQFEEGKGPLVSSLSDELQEAVRQMKHASIKSQGLLKRFAILLATHDHGELNLMERFARMGEHQRGASTVFDDPDPGTLP